MFYEPSKQNHGLPHNPLIALVTPRPIGWISTLSKDGVVNLGAYSFFNLVSGNPPCVMFSASPKADGRPKDSLTNAEETGEFVFNLSTWDTREQMNLTGSIEEPNFDELEAAGLTTAQSKLVKPPRVAESPIHFECRYLQTVALPPGANGSHSNVVFGEVIGIHINDDFIVDGMVDTAAMKPLGRLGYNQYVSVEKAFDLPRLTAEQLRERGIDV